MNSIIKMTLPTPFKVGPVNVYLIKGDSLTLIDTGPKHEDTWNVLKQELKHNHISIQDIDQVVLTHYHPDHVGLVDEILERKQVPVLGHPKSAPYLAREPKHTKEREEFISTLYKLHGVPISLITKLNETQKYLHQYDVPVTLTGYLKEGDYLPGNENWQILDTPGHSPDHISLYCTSTSELIGGDHLIKHISSNAFVEPEYGSLERPRSLVVYQEALKKLLKYPLQIVYSGHGEEIYDAHTLIESRVTKQEERANHIYSFVDDHISAFQISEKLFPHLYIKELPLTMSEVIGHIDLLIEQGRLQIEKVNEQFIFHRM